MMCLSSGSLILQEEIVDETDEYVDVHKRYGCASIAHTTSAILQLTPSRKQLIPLLTGSEWLLLLLHRQLQGLHLLGD